MERLRFLDKFLKFLDLDFISGVLVVAFNAIISFVSPIEGQIHALTIAFFFNIVTGMWADDVTITKRENFSKNKLWKSLLELLAYLGILLMLYSIFYEMGDFDEGKAIIKTINYIMIWWYAQNSLKNLIKINPKSMSLRVIYHLIRFEFIKALPYNIGPIIKDIEQKMEEETEEEKGGGTKFH